MKLGQDIGLYLLYAALLLPALGAMMRTMRMSREFDRNALRSRATAAALAAHAERLRESETADELFRALSACEDTLDADHREWLRLMMEAEWFG